MWVAVILGKAYNVHDLQSKLKTWGLFYGRMNNHIDNYLEVESEWSHCGFSMTCFEK